MPSAYARYGAGSWVVPPARVDGAERIDVGDGVVLMENAEIAVSTGARLRIGNGVRFGRFLTIDCTLSVEIGDDVSGSDLVAITDRDGPLPPRPVVIERGAYLGAGSIVCAGVRVGEGAYVGEGAVVLDDVPAHTLVRGNPAR